MAGSVPNGVRDQLLSAFRERVCEKMDIVPFPHQRQWWAATDGLELLHGVEDPSGHTVRMSDNSIQRWMAVPRLGNGTRARFLADLGAFKIGKSFSSAIWATGFAAIPNARVNLVGLEYDICAPEFDYICDALLSEAGMGLKYDSLQNRPRDGKMWLDLPNGARYEARSWERKDSLKGKEIDAYVYCEAYQLPGIECFTSFSQNLRVRRGYAVFPTTPDRPWVKLLHELGHGADPEWHCTCSIPASVNPFSFDATAKRRDETLMTREKFAIHYEGQLGDFVGRVFNYQRGQATFGPGTDPALFSDPAKPATRENLRVPPGWSVVGGIDTGTFYTGLLVAFSPSGDAYVIEEFPNYRYVAGSAERDEGITIPQWARWLSNGTIAAGGRCNYWADGNSQFKAELRQYGINLLRSSLPLEARTEITREFFEHGRVRLAPWLQVLPFELENAAWPEESTASGKFARVKDRDHTLDCLEHILSRRPLGRGNESAQTRKTWAEGFYGRERKRAPGNIHLGKY